MPPHVCRGQGFPCVCVCLCRCMRACVCVRCCVLTDPFGPVGASQRHPNLQLLITTHTSKHTHTHTHTHTHAHTCTHTHTHTHTHIQVTPSRHWAGFRFVFLTHIHTPPALFRTHAPGPQVDAPPWAAPNASALRINLTAASYIGASVEGAELTLTWRTAKVSRVAGPVVGRGWVHGWASG